VPPPAADIDMDMDMIWRLYHSSRPSTTAPVHLAPHAMLNRTSLSRTLEPLPLPLPSLVATAHRDHQTSPCTDQTTSLPTRCAESAHAAKATSNALSDTVSLLFTSTCLLVSRLAHTAHTPHTPHTPIHTQLSLTHVVSPQIAPRASLRHSLSHSPSPPPAQASAPTLRHGACLIKAQHDHDHDPASLCRSAAMSPRPVDLQQGIAPPSHVRGVSHASPLKRWGCVADQHGAS
jgi:hypothetical protein